MKSLLRNFPLTVVALSSTGFANDGTMMSGYGMKNSMMGGASIALPLDSVAAANNPAGMAKVSTRIDGGLRVFRGTANNAFLGNENSMELTTVIPEGGFNYQYSNDTTLGVSIFGSGMKTDYEKPIVPIPGLNNSSNEIQQISITPTLTKRIGDSFYFGVSPTILYTSVTTKGVPGRADDSDSAVGFGFRVGVLWDATDKLSIGLMYAPKTKAGTWRRYKDNLFATAKGRFDAPEQLGVGVPPRQNSCRLDRILNSGAMMRERRGAIRTGIQG